MHTLTLGKHNPRLAEIRRALDRGVLTSDGCLVVEGPKLIDEAHQSGLALVALFLREDAPAIDVDASTPVYRLDPAAFRKIQSTESSQGAVALVRPRQFSIEDLATKPGGPIVLLARLQDPGNAGTILRMAEAFGCSGCIGLKGTASAHNPKTVRASAGSVFRIPHVWDVDLADAVASLRRNNIALVGAAPRAPRTIPEWDWRRPSAVMIGNEARGLNAEETEACDALLRIPHHPSVQSLNSAAAAAIILYEAFRQRGLE